MNSFAGNCWLVLAQLQNRFFIEHLPVAAYVRCLKEKKNESSVWQKKWTAQSGILCGIANFSRGNKNKLRTFQPQKWKILRTASLKQNLLVLIKKNSVILMMYGHWTIYLLTGKICRFLAWVSWFFTLKISILNCQNIHTAKNTESVHEKLFAIFLKKHRWGLLLLLATAIYSSFLHLQCSWKKITICIVTQVN